MTAVALIMLGLGIVLILAAIRDEPLADIVRRSVGR